MSKTVVFVHGLFMTPLCWEHWVAYFEARGYDCVALGWPGRDRPVEELRAHPDPDLGKLTLVRVVEHFALTVESLDEKPILIGHSMGGLIVQLLLQRDLAAAGVAIDSAPPETVVTTRWSFLRSNWPMLNPFIPKTRPHWMSFEDFQYAFVNGLPPAEQRAAYDRYVVPESRQVLRQLLTNAAIDFSNPHPPLLLLAGADDHIIPAALNETNFHRYQASPSRTDFKVFPGRVHFTIGQSGWQEVADHALGWLRELGL